RNPTMLASGFLDETGGTLLRVFKAGAGAVVTKSIGPEPRTGNTNPTVVELEVGMLNAMGLPNPGMEDFGAEVKVALDGGAVVVGSVYGKDPDEYATVASRLESYGVQAVGLSVPAIRPVGVRCVYEIYEAVDVPIVGVGGVETGRDALEYILAGARAVQIGTGLATRGMSVFADVTSEVAAYLEETGGKS